MSEFINNAKSLKTKLESLPSLAEIPVLVDRQKDLVNQINIGVAKAKGAVVDILWLGGVPFDLDAKANLICRYRINVRTKPIVRDEAALKADVLCQAIVVALWDWKDVESDCYHEWKVLEVDLVPDERLLVYQIIVEVKTELGVSN